MLQHSATRARFDGDDSCSDADEEVAPRRTTLKNTSRCCRASRCAASCTPFVRMSKEDVSRFERQMSMYASSTAAAMTLG